MSAAKLFIGLMSGTSGDAVDATLVAVESEGRMTSIASHSVAIPETVKRRIFAIQTATDTRIQAVCELDVVLAQLYAQAVEGLLTTAGRTRGDIEAIGNHGQTLLHHPNRDPAYTLQAGDNHRLAELTGITVVGDFRRRDLAAGGQAAPLIPAFHKTLVPDSHVSTFLNIGGIANVSRIAPDGLSGFDIGPGNTLMDAWIRQHHGVDYDGGGQWASTGNLNQVLLSDMLEDPYFSLTGPKSTGQDYFNLDWLAQFSVGAYAAEDVQRTLLELTAQTIRAALVNSSGNVVYVFGGGRHNLFLIQRLKACLSSLAIESTHKLGIDPDYMEATAFAWLAQQRLEGRPSSEPEVTGARGRRLLGVIFPA